MRSNVKKKSPNLLDIVHGRRPTSDVNVQSPTRLKIGCRMLKGARGFSHTTGHIISNIFIRPKTSVIVCCIIQTTGRALIYRTIEERGQGHLGRSFLTSCLVSTRIRLRPARGNVVLLNTNSSSQCLVFSHFPSNTPINSTSRIQGRLFTKRPSRTDCGTMDEYRNTRT